MTYQHVIRAVLSMTPLGGRDRMLARKCASVRLFCFLLCFAITLQYKSVTRNASIRVLRSGESIYEDKISSLRRFKDDVREVNEGYECGVGLDKFNDIKEGDMYEAFIMEEVKK